MRCVPIKFHFSVLLGGISSAAIRQNWGIAKQLLDVI